MSTAPPGLVARRPRRTPIRSGCRQRGRSPDCLVELSRSAALTERGGTRRAGRDQGMGGGSGAAVAVEPRSARGRWRLRIPCAPARVSAGRVPSRSASALVSDPPQVRRSDRRLGDEDQELEQYERMTALRRWGTRQHVSLFPPQDDSGHRPPRDQWTKSTLTAEALQGHPWSY